MAQHKMVAGFRGRKGKALVHGHIQKSNRDQLILLAIFLTLAIAVLSVEMS